MIPERIREIQAEAYTNEGCTSFDVVREVLSALGKQEAENHRLREDCAHLHRLADDGRRYRAMLTHYSNVIVRFGPPDWVKVREGDVVPVPRTECLSAMCDLIEKLEAEAALQ